MTTQRKRRVVITGIGAVTPIGTTMDHTWNGVIEGRKGVAKTKIFEASEFPCDFSYQVDGFVLRRDKLPDQNIERYFNRAAGFGWNAAWEAIEQSGVLSDSNLDRQKLCVCLGVGMGCASLEWYGDVYLEGLISRDESIAYYEKHYPSTLTTMITAAIGAHGGSSTVHTACASSGQAIGEAFHIIANGEADVVVTGGADSMINPFQVAGFCLLGALSSRKDSPETASRPFDADREGFVLGEGAAMFVFEEYERAVQRGARILGEVVGFGVTESAYRITDLHPEGRGTIEAMQMALDDAGISANDVGYINAHGTSTQLNDRIESLAISKVFPKETSSVVVSSTKSMTGHLISAAGALEFALAVYSLRHSVIPPSVNLFQQDPSCEITVAGSSPTPCHADYALSNSIGFGGSNTSVIARRFK